ncbi:MAG: hypothetical protein IPM57_02815 [Oligoflexia bacterium]|nr:hypothetical protein [Oligoflexia bacterium]
MSALKEFFENLKERLSALLAEQQESELYIKLKDQYEELPPNTQKLVKYFSYLLVSMFLLWMPVTNILDSLDQNNEFSDRRYAVKEFLKLQREFSQIPNVPTAQAPINFKGTMDQKIIAQGVTTSQIREASADNKSTLQDVEVNGIRYFIQHVTVKQALNIAYELEQVDKSLKVEDFELIAEQKDPHYYDLKLRLINFTPKSTQKVSTNAK